MHRLKIQVFSDLTAKAPTNSISQAGQVSISSEMALSTAVTNPAPTRVSGQKSCRAKVSQKFPCFHWGCKAGGRVGRLLTQKGNKNSYLSAHIIAILVGLMISSHKHTPPPFPPCAFQNLKAHWGGKQGKVYLVHRPFITPIHRLKPTSGMNPS